MSAGIPVAGAELVPFPGTGARYTSPSRTVRFSDCSPSGQLRFDSYARYAEDTSADDFYSSPALVPVVWVIRRAVIEVERHAVLNERVDTSVWCSALGARWSERRFTTVGEMGARYEMASLWVCLDPETFRAVPVPSEIHDYYGTATGGRSVSSKLVHADPGPSAVERPWQLRHADYDPLGHVHNTAYWEVVADEIGRRPELDGRLRAEAEYRMPVEMDAEVHLLVADEDDAIDVWMVQGDRVHTSIRLSVVPDEAAEHLSV